MMSINSNEWSHPVYLAAATDPTVSLYRGASVVDAMVHCPADAAPALPPPPNTDAHLHIVDPQHAFVDEMWEASKVDGGWACQAWNRNDLTGPGVGQGGVRAYGGSAIGGLIRSGELTSAIRHALAFAIEQGQQQDAFVWPATTNDQFAAAGYTGNLQMDGPARGHPSRRGPLLAGAQPGGARAGACAPGLRRLPRRLRR
jgi:hypothetical protein